ncbi:MAG: flagellar filament capping protein FliD [Gammaproteobacteria bacterium]|nr:flagellar filament capping protein FliD [Gammaproteobacteria bacterium]
MASLSTQGVGSGLDIAGIVSKIMTLEKAPLVKLGTRQVELQTQLSAYGKLKSSVAKLQTGLTDMVEPDSFEAAKASSSTPTVLTASADAGAAKGSYVVEVRRIAEAHRMVAGTVLANADTATVGSADETMTLKVGSKSFTVNVGGKTLNQIRDAINSATGNAGVTASILRDDQGSRLTLSANSTGAAGFIEVSYQSVSAPSTPGPDLLGLTATNVDRNASGGFTSADLDAELRLENSFTVTSSTNNVSGVLDGLTLNLIAAGTSTVSVARDTSGVTAGMQQFVAAFNDVLKTLDDLRAQTLSDDSASLLAFETQLRNAIGARVSGSSQFSTLAELGIVTKKDGTLTVEASKFTKAMGKDPDGITAMFTNTVNGAAVRLKRVTDDVLGAGGMFDGREQSLKGRIRQTEKQRTNMEYRLGQREIALNKQFNTLDTLIAGLTTSGNYISTQMAALGIGK